MKIESIVLRELSMSLINPFTTSFGETRERRVLLAEVRAEGLSGWGECTAGEHPYFSEESTDTAWITILQELVPLLVAAEDQRGGKCPEIFRPVRGHRMAKAAVENALWDLEAQMRGVPLYELLGGTRETIACGVSIGIQPSLEKLMDKVGSALSEGYQRIKLKIRPGWDVELVAAVREAVGPDILLQVDANAAYTLDDVDALRRLDEYNLACIEQPLAWDAMLEHAELQRSLSTPICLDETLRSFDDVRRALDIGACRNVNLKPGRVGGLTASLRIAELCRSRGVALWCGGMMESGIGRAGNLALCSVAGFTEPADMSPASVLFEWDLVDPTFAVGPDGTVAVPDAPGLGFPVRLDRVAAQTLRRTVVKVS